MRHISRLEAAFAVLFSLRMRILVADDQPAVLEAARFLLKSNGYAATTAASPREVLQLTASEAFDLILMDLNYARDTTSGQEGLDLLAGLRTAGVETPVVVMTAWGTLDIAVEAMRRGACDFVQKPWDNAHLMETIEKQVSKARASRSDMDIARNVQAKLLPRDGPAIPSLDYAGRCVPARAVGGDYYDWLDLGGGQTGFLLADVSGKGIGAAMLMAHLHAAFHTRVSLGYSDAPALVAGVNRQFYESSPTEQYATLFFARYDPRTSRLHYVNAGHPAALVRRADGSVERLASTSMPVGVFSFWASDERVVSLGPGDTVLVYSDGVVEAGVYTGEEFGENRIVEAAVAPTAASVVDHLCTCVLAYEAEQHDDCTLLVLRRV
jgi:sigma-B regulation protein RsbU (phosphoserine phosphatase)